MVTITLSQRAVFGVIFIPRALKISWKSLYVALAIVIALAMIFYAFLAVSLTAGPYAINNYKQEISQLKEENRMLEIDLAKAGSLGSISARAKALGMEKTTKVKYIEVSVDSSLAKAR